MILSLIDLLKKNKIIIIIALIIVFIIAIAIIGYLRNKKHKYKTSDVACIGIFTAFSIVLYFLKFNLPFIFPSFLEINFSLLPVIIIGYMLGPTEAVVVVILRAVIKIPFTSTFCVGELADLLIGIPVALVTSLNYLKKHTKKGAVVSLVLGVLTWVVISIFTNYFINVPFFIQLYCNGQIDNFVAALSIIPGVNVNNYMWKYILFAVIPFNTLISLVVCIVTFLVYKKVSVLFDKISRKNDDIIDTR